MGKGVSKEEAAVSGADQPSPQHESGQQWPLQEGVTRTYLGLG